MKQYLEQAIHDAQKSGKRAIFKTVVENMLTVKANNRLNLLRKDESGKMVAGAKSSGRIQESAQVNKLDHFEIVGNVRHEEGRGPSVWTAYVEPYATISIDDVAVDQAAINALRKCIGSGVVQVQSDRGGGFFVHFNAETIDPDQAKDQLRRIIVGTTGVPTVNVK